MINVIDSPCGSGKTIWSIQYINNLPAESKVLFVTPFLSECKRITKACKDKKFIQPNTKSGDGRKIVSLLRHVKHKRNIVTTHALFKNFDQEILDEIKKRNYILIIDEAMNVLNNISVFPDKSKTVKTNDNVISKSDVQNLIKSKIINTNEQGELIWENEIKLAKYEFLKQKSNLGNLFLIGDDLLMWTFPVGLFSEEIFKRIFILTYQFDYQVQSYYFKYYNIPYKKFEVVRGKKRCNIVPFGAREVDLQFRRRAKKLIVICDRDRLNKVGTSELNMDGVVKRTSLSLGWYQNNPKQINVLQKNVTNYWKNIVGGAGADRMWTCFKKQSTQMATSVLSKKNYISINARATNDFANKKYLCYLVNRYVHPSMRRFFNQREIQVDQDMFALAELIQWIYRSAIRNGEKIYIYIPSGRMRNLLKNWLDV